MVARDSTGSSTASNDSAQFSSSSGSPSSIALTTEAVQSVREVCVATRPSGVSLRRSHAAPCSCGSMMSGNLAHEVMIAAFSEERRSLCKRVDLLHLRRRDLAAQQVRDPLLAHERLAVLAVKRADVRDERGRNLWAASRRPVKHPPHHQKSHHKHQLAAAVVLGVRGQKVGQQQFKRAELLQADSKQQRLSSSFPALAGAHSGRILVNIPNERKLNFSAERASTDAHAANHKSAKARMHAYAHAETCTQQAACRRMRVFSAFTRARTQL
eukprot:4579315-Pleurochrysis_carterae.AAC.1